MGATSVREPPTYFSEVRDGARERWLQLESDADLAGPWRLLFEQVQSPRHVLSELLQNADDVGATKASARIAGGRLIFEHDGRDFNRDEFQSLCRFGFSNKRKLHTIGFRGVGFKSTFSLGESVEVLTPSLAVRFEKRRFTEPVWIDRAPPTQVTRVSVNLHDARRERELRKNLQEWVGSPASLLFFNHLTQLTIGDVVLRKEVIGPGPVDGSQRLRLTGRGQADILMLSSDEEPLPKAAIDEIRHERNVDDLTLPPCRVELVLGLHGSNRLYVVLPTAVVVDTPFSCNAPFIQDPARMGIKDPALSPTNRWLLMRAGRLAAEVMLKWLRNESLDLPTRCAAYALVPEPVGEGESLSASSVATICEGFAQRAGRAALLLSDDGRLVTGKHCLSPPLEAYEVWSSDELRDVFRAQQQAVLCKDVTREHRLRLESWGWLQQLSEVDLLWRLEQRDSVPRPDTHPRLLALWNMVQRCVRRDWRGQRLRLLSIVPVEGSDVLLPARDVVRLPVKRENVSDAAWGFLLRLVHVADRGWLRFLGPASSTDRTRSPARELRQTLMLDRTSEPGTIATAACDRLFKRADASMSDLVRMAQLMAALDTRPPASFRCVTVDGARRSQADGVVASLDPLLETLVPEDWARSHLLHDAYLNTDPFCTLGQWQDWIRSGKSGFSPFIPFCRTKEEIWGNEKLAKRLAARSASPPSFLPYVTCDYRLYDEDFDARLVRYWSRRTDESVWAEVLRGVLEAPVSCWHDHTHASVSQIATTGSERELEVGLLPAAWILRFRGLQCLLDTYGQAHLPVELYLRTPETEALMGVEPFVRADLDTELTKPLLRLLGVRDTPAELTGLLDRVRALASADDEALLAEILKWYRAIDVASARLPRDELEELRVAFQHEALILTSTGDWANASEVFQYSGDVDLVQAPLVHPAASDLTMWPRVGVAPRPTADLILDWLSGLSSGEPLKEGTVRRVRSALRAYPDDVWNTCSHWLALDNTWMPVDRLRFRFAAGSRTDWSTLFAPVKAATADLQMLPQDVVARAPFASLIDLVSSVSYRPSALPQGSTSKEHKGWLGSLAANLVRVRAEKDDDTERIREAGARLLKSQWHTVRRADLLRVTPYIDGAPAGESSSPSVAWHETTIYVRQGPPSSWYDGAVHELSKPFAAQPVTEAVKACIERDEHFVKQYMQEHFVLEEPAREQAPVDDEPSEEPPSGEGGLEGAAQQVERSEAYAGPADADDSHDEGPERSTRRRRPQPFRAFATRCGYRWDEEREHFAHPDGSTLESAEPPLHWNKVGMNGDISVSYWVAAQCLDRGGVEVPADVWELLKRNPRAFSLILEDLSGLPHEIGGVELAEMVRTEEVLLYPAKYRLRRANGA